MNYGYKKQVDTSFEDTVIKVKEELKKEGFGILTEIDVKDTMKKKIDADYGDYIILGACNPKFADKVLQVNKEIGLLLPCNVIVYKEKDIITISAIMPTVAMSVASIPELEGIANEVQEKLKKVINSI